MFKYNLSIAAIMKFEEPYVAEWIEFHRLVGVDHFYIYDNSDDFSLEKLLKIYTDLGIVTLHHVPGPVKMFESYNHCIRNYKDESEYIAFIDADEFITPTPGCDINIYRSICKLFEMYSNDWYYLLPSLKPGGIGINWFVFGDNDHKTKPEGLVIENYTWRGIDYPEDNHIKTIVNPRVVESFSNPHFPNYKKGYCCVSQLGSIISGPFFPDGSRQYMRINHYFYKSKEEFDLRYERKKADTNISKEDLKANLDRLKKNLKEVNVRVDNSATRFIQDTKNNMLKMGFDPKTGLHKEY